MRKRVFNLMLVLAIVGMTAPAYAESQGVAGGKTLSIIEFSLLASNHGVPANIVAGKYDAYRQGRLPMTTLETSNVR